MADREPVPPIGTQLGRLAAADPGAPAVTCDGRTLTRGELESLTNRLARAYAARGVRQGDYVTVALPNSVGWVAATVAAWKLGAVPQPLSARLPDAEYAGLLDLRPRALLVGRPDPRGLVASVPGDFDPGAEFSDNPLPEAVSPSWKSMASGGSTGRPKLIEAGGDGRLRGGLVAEMMGNLPTDTQLVPVPLSHNTGFTSATMALLTGQHLVLMNRFDPHEFLRLVTEHRVTYLACVPTIMQRLLPVYRADRAAAAPRYDLSSVRRWWHLAAPCPPAVKEAWIEILGPEVVWELYGGTELQAVTFISGTEWLAHRGSVGTVVSGEMTVLDDDGNECPPGVLGEIYLRPRPGARPTYRYIGSAARQRDGWDSLGDLGWFDADGYLYLADRRVDMFTTGGRNVYPAEIENALSEHPDVLSCLVVGIPHEDLGQVPHALVQTAGPGLDEEAVRAFVAERLAAYKVPRSVEFVDAPLRDDAGKARRSAVREEVIARNAVHVIARPAPPGSQ